MNFDSMLIAKTKTISVLFQFNRAIEKKMRVAFEQCDSIYNNNIHLETNSFVCTADTSTCACASFWNLILVFHLYAWDYWTPRFDHNRCLSCAQLFQMFFFVFVLFKLAKINWNINAWLLNRMNGNSYSCNSLTHSFTHFASNVALSFSLSGKKILTLSVSLSFQSSWFITSLTSCVCVWYWSVCEFECANSAY